jgi:hypothetical protein
MNFMCSGGSFLERLQHGIEGRSREHVDFVDDVDLEPPARRRVLRGLEELAHLVDLGVGRRIDLEQVDEAAGVDLEARRALAAGLRGDAGVAVEALREDPGERGLAHAAGPGEEVCVMQPVLLERMAKRAHDVLLPHQAAEIPRPPFPGKYLIAHRLINSRRARTPALAAPGCGCFLPDLTRFTGLQCGEARRDPL